MQPLYSLSKPAQFILPLLWNRLLFKDSRRGLGAVSSSRVHSVLRGRLRRDAVADGSSRLSKHDFDDGLNLNGYAIQECWLVDVLAHGGLGLLHERRRAADQSDLSNVAILPDDDLKVDLAFDACLFRFGRGEEVGFRNSRAYSYSRGHASGAGDCDSVG